MSSNTGAQNHQFGPRVSGVRFIPWSPPPPQLPPPPYDPAPVLNMPLSELRPFPTYRPRCSPAPVQELRPILNARIPDLRTRTGPLALHPRNPPARGLVFIEPLIVEREWKDRLTVVFKLQEFSLEWDFVPRISIWSKLSVSRKTCEKRCIFQSAVDFISSRYRTYASC